jgi:hypothetical protein
MLRMTTCSFRHAAHERLEQLTGTAGRTTSEDKITNCLSVRETIVGFAIISRAREFLANPLS